MNLNKQQSKKNKKKHISKMKTKFKEIVKEKNGPKGLEPTRYGDWEKNGRCSDF